MQSTSVYSALGMCLFGLSLAWGEEVWLCPKPGFGFLKTDRPTLGCFPAEHRPGQEGAGPAQSTPPPSDPANRELLEATCRDYWSWVELNRRSGGGISFSSPQERVRYRELQQRFGFYPEVPAACGKRSIYNGGARWERLSVDNLVSLTDKNLAKQEWTHSRAIMNERF